MTIQKAIVETELKDIPLYYRGKVRDVYDLGENLLIVATDRISAFDYVLPTPIPDKGKILTQMSIFWFDYLKDVIPSHFITGDVDEFPSSLLPHKSLLEGRSMLVRKASRIDIECVVRGYITGSAWKEYKESGEVCGIRLAKNLKESSPFSEPIFTPATKAEKGDHDINISIDELVQKVGKKLGTLLKEKSIELYRKAMEYAKTKRIILSDTKFEFGYRNDEVILIDEILTPDSSRFWDMDKYREGEHQESFDKQFVRDYLLGTDWDRNSPPPELPEDIVRGTRSKYLDIYERLVGKPFESV